MMIIIISYVLAVLLCNMFTNKLTISNFKS